MKKYICIITAILFVFSLQSCDDELADELFVKGSYLVKNGWQEYKLKIEKDNTVVLPIAIALNGTSNNTKDVTVNLVTDPDTLAAYNLDRFRNQTELYFEEIPETYYSFDNTSYVIPKGKNDVVANVVIDLNKIDYIYEEYVLPIKIASTDGALIGESKYSKVLAQLDFTNEFTGNYSGTGKLKQKNSQYELNVDGVKLMGSSVNSCYFYAGNITRDTNIDYYKYIVDITIDDNNNLTLSSKLPKLELNPIKAEINRKYRLHTTDNRYYIETSTLELKYEYKDQDDTNITYEYSGTLTLIQDVIKEDYPDVEISEI